MQTLVNALKTVLTVFNSIVFFLSYSTWYFVSVTFKTCDEMFRLLPKEIQYQLHCLKTRQVTRNNREPWGFFCFGWGYLALNSLNIFDTGLTKLLAGFQMFYFNGSLTQWKIKDSTQQKILVEWTNSFSMHTILAYYRFYKLNSSKNINELEAMQFKLRQRFKHLSQR